MAENRRIFTVTELTRLIRTTLEGAVGTVWLEGELSNLRQPSSGHYYFTLKDENAQITAVLFRGNQRGLSFKPQDGLLVRVYGEISVYEKSGNYQIIVRSIEEGGKGALQAKFEALKEKLHKEGLFDPARKRPLPMLPQRLGLVTSPTGAAIRDILNVVSRRFPNLHIVLAPAKVQGVGASEEIAAGIDMLNEFGSLDVMIVGRGGGSMEDLWCFNEEVVARAIYRSKIPVISAVGHEIDFTISDFVADLRAPTPSAAAELVVGRKEEFEEALRTIGRRVASCATQALLASRNRLLRVSRSYVFREPRNMVKQYLQRVDTLELRMAHEVRQGIGGGRQRLHDLGLQMRHSLDTARQAAWQNLKTLGVHLGALNPLAVLGRGYSITWDSRGRIIRHAATARPGQRIVTRVFDGNIESEVSESHDSQEDR